MALTQHLVNTLNVCGTYALIAVGFALFFGVINLINFAHSEIYMLGGFSGLWAYSLLHAQLASSPFVLFMAVLLLAGLIPGIVGVGIERMAFRPVRELPPLVAIITSVAVGIMIREAVQNFVPDGANPHPFPDPFGEWTLSIGEAVVTGTQLAAMCVAAVLVSGVFLLVRFTKFGRHMRAVCHDSEAAQMLGINVHRTVAMTFFLGCALGGVAGAMNGMAYGAVRFDMGLLAGFKGFTCAGVGGLTNVYGAVVGAILISCLETVFAGFVPGGSAYSDILCFLVLIVVLAYRPRGLLGGSTRDRA